LQKLNSRSSEFPVTLYRLQQFILTKEAEKSKNKPGAKATNAEHAQEAFQEVSTSDAFAGPMESFRKILPV
jgi:hypothetical protein